MPPEKIEKVNKAKSKSRIRWKERDLGEPLALLPKSKEV